MWGWYYFEQGNIACEGIWNICFNELSSWQIYPSEWRDPYEYPKEILGRNAHIHHYNVGLAFVIIRIIYN